MVDDLALTVPIERNKKILQTYGDYAYVFYEQEAIRCFKSFRKNAGSIKDIPIYCLCPTNKPISQKTLKELKSLDVIYIEDENKDVSDSDIIFISIPYTGYYFEKLKPLKEKYHLRIDLDFEIRKPFDMSIFDKSTIDEYTLIGLDDSSFENHNKELSRISYESSHFDTGFVLTNRHNGFYEKFYNLCLNRKPFKEQTWLNIQKQMGSGSKFFEEEFVVDYMKRYDIANIKGYPISSYELEHINTKDTAFVYHEHIKLKDCFDEYL